jgi:hypothetical protein
MPFLQTSAINVSDDSLCGTIFGGACHAERFQPNNFSSVEIAEVIKISEKLCLFFENVNEA